MEGGSRAGRFPVRLLPPGIRPAQAEPCRAMV